MIKQLVRTNRYKSTQIIGLKHKDQQSRRYIDTYQYLGHSSSYTNIEEQVINNKHNIVYGIQPFSVQNCTNIQCIFDKFSPNCIMLGNYSLQSFQQLLDPSFYYSQPIKVYNQQSTILTDIQAKTNLIDYFLNQFHKSQKTFRIRKNNIYYHADQDQRLLKFDGDLTLGYMACNKSNSKLMFADVDYFLLLEDLVLSYDSHQLENIFMNAVYIYHRLIEQRSQQSRRFKHPVRSEMIIDTFKSIVANNFKDQLFRKLMVYQASMMKSCIDSFGATMLTTRDPFVEPICEMINRNDLPPFNSIFRSYLKPTTTSKKFVKTKNRIKINNANNTISSKYDSKEQDINNYSKLDCLEVDEIIQRYVLLNLMVGNDFQEFLYRGHDVLEGSIFAEKFKQVSNEELVSIYDKWFQKYRKELHDIQNTEIVQSVNDDSSTKMDQIKLEAKRQEIQHRKYKFNLYVKKKTKHNLLLDLKISSMIEKQIQKERDEGLMDVKRAKQIQQYREGHYSYENLFIMMKYYAQANHKLGGIIRLPKVFKKVLPSLMLQNAKQIEEVEQLLRQKQLMEQQQKQINAQKYLESFKGLSGYEQLKEQLESKSIIFMGPDDHENQELLDPEMKRMYKIIEGDYQETQRMLDMETIGPDQLQKSTFQQIAELKFIRARDGQIEPSVQTKHDQEQLMQVVKKIHEMDLEQKSKKSKESKDQQKQKEPKSSQ